MADDQPSPEAPAKPKEVQIAPDAEIIQRGAAIARDEKAGAPQADVAEERKALADFANANPGAAKQAIMEVAGETMSTPKGSAARDQDAKVLDEVVKAAPDQARADVAYLQSREPANDPAKAAKYEEAIALINSDLPPKGEPAKRSELQLTPDAEIIQRSAAIVRDEQAGVPQADLAKERKELADFAKANPDAARSAVIELAGEAASAPKGSAERNQDARVLDEVVKAAPEPAKEVAEFIRNNRPVVADENPNPRDKANADKANDEIALIKNALPKEDTQSRAEPSVETKPAPERDAARAHPVSERLQNLEDGIKKDVATLAAATNDKDRAAASKELEHDVKAAPEAARNYIKDTDITKINDPAMMDALVAARDALQKSDVANIERAARAGNDQEIRRLAGNDNAAEQQVMKDLKGKSPEADAMMAEIQAALKGAGVKTQMGANVNELPTITVTASRLPPQQSEGRGQG
jgi:hypothetical protein